MDEAAQCPTQIFRYPVEQLCKRYHIKRPFAESAFYHIGCYSNTVSICISKEVSEIECTSVEGVDRNLRNVTIGNHKRVVQYDLSKAVQIAENTRAIVASFKRNDVRIRKKIASKYGKSRTNRINQIHHHHVSKAAVTEAKENKNAIALEEDITHIWRLYIERAMAKAGIIAPN